MNNINIFPIFNQNIPEIQDEFKRIRTTTMKHDYKCLLIEDREDTNTTLLPKKSNHTFAFAAYDNNKMVGYINGDFTGNLATVSRLFVLPEYQGNKIGTKLLRNAESAMSLYSRQMGLGALYAASNFYKKCGYSSYFVENEFRKSIIQSGKSSLAPVFLPTTNIIKTFANISDYPLQNFDRKKIIAAHTPVFAYRNIDSKICGFYIHGHTPDMFISKEYSPILIQKRIQSYLDFTNRKSK